MRKHIAGAGVLVAAAVTAAAALAQERVQAGSLTCDVSAGLGLILGSQRQVYCTFTPALPGAVEVYTGSITRIGLDLGATAGGVMICADRASRGRARGRICRRERGGVILRRPGRECARGRLRQHGCASAGFGSGSGRFEPRRRHRRPSTAVRALNLTTGLARRAVGGSVANRGLRTPAGVASVASPEPECEQPPALARTRNRCGRARPCQAARPLER